MLELTARSLRRDVAFVARETGIPAGSAAVGAMAGCAIARQVRGVRAAVVDTAVIGGGALMALKGRGKIVPYAGAGLVFGALWGMLGK